MQPFKISFKALKEYERLHNGALIDHTGELPKRRLTAHIKTCDELGLYRDISPTKSVYLIGNMRVVVDDERCLITNIFESKEQTKMFPEYSMRLRQYSAELGISRRGKSFQRNWRDNYDD